MVKASKSKTEKKLFVDVEVKPTEDKSGKIDGNDITVKNYDSDNLSERMKPTKEKIWVKLRDGGSSWGYGRIFIINRQFKEFPHNEFVKEGIRDGVLIPLEPHEIAEVQKQQTK